ncbi:TonB-dependent receptor [Tsuneonella rigui]|uniref:TonB-dependent receptor n=1 Tax=Tsuneonella rigui TaxID=1708790 RepID=UPI000F7F1124|nr:carboxypeptidase regulatory-like domain-containing protein [Tsuneonella rigui]
MKLKYLLAASVVSLSAAAILPAPAFAQQITTGIEGTVTDADGNPLSGATVTITDTRTGAARDITTGADGRFVATGLVTGGPYTVAANAGGFEGQTVNDIQTTLQGNTSLTFSLTSGSGEIVVTGSRVQVTQLAVGPGTSFTAEVLENAPTFNRDIRDIIRIDPRVSLDRDDGGNGVDRVSCLGGNDRGNAFTVDGISQGDVYGLNESGFSSRSSVPIPYDAVRETQVQFAPFDVDYSNFTGCAINVVTKSGTNDYQFGGYFEYSNNDLRGDELNDRGTIKPVPPIGPEKRYGVYLGGPVIKDRLFLFGAYEHQEASQSQDEGPSGAGFVNPANGVSQAQFDEISAVLKSVYGIDTGPIVTNRDYTNDRYFVRADLQITDNHRLEATYQRLEEASVKPDDLTISGTFGPTIVGRNTFLNSGTKSNYYSARLYSNWTDKFSTELRYSRAEVQDLQDPIGGGEAQSDNPIPRIVVGVDNATGPDGAVGAGPGFSRAANDLRTTIQQYRAVAKLDAGAHQLKIGAELNSSDLFNLFIQNGTGTLYFRNINDLKAGLLSPGTGNFQTSSSIANIVNGAIEGAIGNFSSTGDPRDAAADFNRSIYSVFAQDDWQINDQLSAVLGVRVDWYDGGHPKVNPLYAQRYGFSNTTSFSNIDPIIMPRLALTYDMNDFAVFSRAQLRAGVGIFSGGDPAVFYANAFQNDGRGFAQGTLQDAGCPAQSPATQVDVVVNGQFTGVPQCVINFAASQAAKGLGDTQGIDPDIQQPSVLRANIGFSSELNFTDTGFFSGWNLNLDYIYSKYRNPLTLVDLAAVPATATFGTNAAPNGPALGINGFTIDGRPIYRSIDPSVAGCNAKLVDITPTPIYTGVTGACFNTQRDDELLLTNAGSYESHIASAILSKNFNGGLITEGGSVFFSLGYAYTDAQDRRSMYRSTAGSNYDGTAAFDRQNPAASRSFFSSKHNITAQMSFKEEFFSDLASRLGITFVARSGRPYSLTFSGGSVFGDSVSGSDNALVYLPTGVNDPNISPTSNMAAVQGLVDFANGLGCARKYIGTSIPRNTCSNDWYYDMDLSLSQEIPGPGRFFGRNDKIKLYASMDNFLNFLDSSWNLQHRRNFEGFQDVASVSGVDAQGRYIFIPSPNGQGYSTFANDNGVNVSSSVWRVKFGISYDF